MNIQEAAQELLAGKLVVFPTETVYGLGALASNAEAVKTIFAVKGRPAINPLIVHIAGEEQLPELVREIPQTAKLLMKRFWPGPLTICFQKSNKVSDLVTAGLPTVCIRRPDHAMAQQLLELVGQPVAAPSANLSGRPSTTTFEDAKRQLQNLGVGILDGGKTPLGLESTVVDCSGDRVVILRPGSISKADLQSVLTEGVSDESNSEKISSPGQLLIHYQPKGALTVLLGTRGKRRHWISEQKFNSQEKLVFGAVGSGISGEQFMLADREEDLQTYAAKLYEFLNWCDLHGALKIILELPSTDDPLLPAVINRLEKASGGNIIRL